MYHQRESEVELLSNVAPMSFTINKQVEVVGDGLGVDGLCIERLVEAEGEGLAVRVELGGPDESGSLEIVVDAGGIIDDLGEVLDSISTEILKTIGHRHGHVVGDKDGLSLLDL